MRDHYREFSHPLLDLSPQPTTDLFAEMTRIADELRSHPTFVAEDLQAAFRQVQRVRLPNLSRDEWLWLFAVWHDSDRARQEAEAAETHARVAALWAKRDGLFGERASASSDARSDVDVRLAEIARALAAAFEARGGRAVMRVR